MKGNPIQSLVLPQIPDIPIPYSILKNSKKHKKNKPATPIPTSHAKITKFNFSGRELVKKTPRTRQTRY